MTLQPTFRRFRNQDARAHGSLRSILLLLAVPLAFLTGTQARDWYIRLQHAATAPRPVVARADLTSHEQHTIDLFRASAPSVVYITRKSVRRDPFSFNVLEVPSGTGSGFIWDRAGHIVTNFHVIQGANSAEVTLADQSTWDATLVGIEPDKDLAVLKIDAPPASLTPIAVGTSSDLLVGQNVYAIGNPFGLDQTLTTGVISGLGREIEALNRRPIQGVIQTDAAVNPGNSGGPLLDSSGRLIGVNTAIFSPSGAYAGVGFAVPADTINRIVPQLVQHGRVIKPVIGISLIDDSFARRLGVEGLIFFQVEPGSGAEKAGLETTKQDRQGRIVLGDVIVAINGTSVRGSDDLFRALDGRNVGDIVTVRLRRNGKEAEVKIRLSSSST
ncbi:MAG TPA: trypsin-like peptidase domain-containing protein [Verrucomicrobiales bacterium]|nr:trypsin-like peptidase domain-containing protein [Verrucomicrobiales bacterium]